MQVIIHVMVKKGKASLREQIVEQIEKRGEDGLFVEFHHVKHRSKGWAKIKREKSHGALNIEWDADARMLVARAITRGGNKPDELVGSFVSFLLRRFGKRIESMVLRTVE